MNKTIRQMTATAAAALTLALGAAGAANATVKTFDFNLYEKAFSGSLGTVTVDDEHGANTLYVNVNLADNTFFQIDGKSGTKNQALWFDLANANIPLTYNFITPLNGAYPTGGLFEGGQYNDGAYRTGNGFLSGFDYLVSVKDSVGGKDYYGGVNNLTFTIAGAGLTLNSLTSQSETGNGVTANAFFGADLRQCIGTAPCLTGPVGATLVPPPGGGGGGNGNPVPEPATWALMIIGFGGVGSMMRRRRLAFA